MQKQERRKKILYFASGPASFVKNDIEILSKVYNVFVFYFAPSKKIYTPISYIKQFFFLLTHIWSTDVLICFFGGYHSFLPTLVGKFFSKPSLVIVGGTDCVAFPSINYGNFNKGVLGKITCMSYKMASYILPVHKSLILCDYTYQDADFNKQGYMNFCKELKTPNEVISFGFDPEKWNTSSQKKPDSFITVAAGLGSAYRVKLKGVDLILEAAKSFPDAHFSIIGFPKGYQLPGNPANVTAYSFVSNDELKDIYNKHEFYLQVSMSEGFPNAICEAMTCGCIPIGSNVGAIPDIVGDSGFILDKRDAEKFKGLVKQAISSDKKALSEKARQRILTNYPKDLREKQLLSLLSKLSV
ncbi:MAG TPA: glycosyltransferase family 4 protein [Bacteroidia bacterium]|jgi:glycosyltransferase involved in cell wall biosynthesis|nr:glycosyltransferase family 4 protein [Bacteroidia bacterium]